MTEPQIDERRRFAMIPEDMLFDPEIPGEAVKVFGVLHRYGSMPDRCYPSVRLIAEKAAISPRSVRRHIALLESKSWLQRVARKTEAGDSDSNAYRLFPQRGGTDNPDSTHDGGADTNGSTPGQECQEVRSPVTGGYGQERPGGTDTGVRQKRAIEREPLNEKRAQPRRADDQRAATIIDISTREERPPAPTFEDFWAIWTLKRSRKDAAKAWDQALKAGHDPVVIIEGARQFLADPELEPRFVPYGATFIRGERWIDEPLPQRGAQSAGHPEQPLTSTPIHAASERF